MKLILIIVLSCTFTAVCIAAGKISVEDFNRKAAHIEELMGSHDLDEAFSKLADAYKIVGRRSPLYLRRLDDLTKKITDENIRGEVIEKLETEYVLLERYIEQILFNDLEKRLLRFGIRNYDQLERKIIFYDLQKGSGLPFIKFILDRSPFCSIFVYSNQLQDEESTKFSRTAILLEEMSLRKVYPGQITRLGQMLLKLKSYCRLLKQTNPNEISKKLKRIKITSL